MLWLCNLNIYEETLNFEEVANKIISEERRLEGEDNTQSNSVLVSIGRPYMKKTNEICVTCWTYEKIGHVKYKCPDGTTSEKDFESNTSNVSLTMGGDDLF